MKGTVKVFADTKLGAYRLRACADYGETVGEIDEENNCATGTETIKVQGCRPGSLTIRAPRTASRALATLPGMDNSRRVYSSEDGRIRPPVPGRTPAPRGPQAPNDGVVRIFRDRSGRNGKVVTVIRGLPVREVEGLAAALKRLCGAGGAIKDGAVEIQGDHRERIAEHLRALGHTVKLAGG